MNFNSSLRINGKWKVSSVQNQNVLSYKLLLSLCANDELLSRIKHESILCDQFLILHYHYLAFSVNCSLLRVHMALEQAFSFLDEEY